MLQRYLVCNFCGYCLPINSSAELILEHKCPCCDENNWELKFEKEADKLPEGDNFPKLDRDKIYEIGKTDKHPNLNKDGNPRIFKINFITKEELNNFKLDLISVKFLKDLEKI